MFNYQCSLFAAQLSTPTLHMRALVLSFILFTSGITTHAAVAVKPIDTTILSIRKWTKQDFLARYATDDTSTALINYYFARRKKAEKDVAIFGGALVLEIAATAIISSEIDLGEGEGATLRGLALIIPAAIALIITAWIFDLSFIDRYIFFTKKGLVRELEIHRSGRPIRKSTSSNRLFKALLAAEKKF